MYFTLHVTIVDLLAFVSYVTVLLDYMHYSNKIDGRV